MFFMFTEIRKFERNNSSRESESGRENSRMILGERWEQEQTFHQTSEDGAEASASGMLLQSDASTTDSILVLMVAMPTE